MDPIINPWLFYLMQLVSGVKWAGLTFGICGTILLFIAIPCYIYYSAQGENHYYDYDTLAKIWKNLLNIAFPIAIIGMLLGIFIPTSETVGTMIVCHYATVDNINIVYDTIMNTARDLIGLF